MEPKCQGKEDNPPRRNCLHEILDSLVVQYNDYRRFNLELQNLKKEFKCEMTRLQFPCEEYKKLMCSKLSDQPKDESFMQRVSQINDTYNCFTKRVTELTQQIDEIVKNAQMCVTALRTSKENLRKSHEYKVENLKRLMMQSCDPKQITSYENQICKMQKLFTKEVTYVRQCETFLQPFFQQVRMDSRQEYVPCDVFKGYEWFPQEKRFDTVDAYAEQIKAKMGRTLIQAFAQQHIQRPTDVNGFLAAYLMNLERNQKLLQEKMKLLEPQEFTTGCFELVL